MSRKLIEKVSNRVSKKIIKALNDELKENRNKLSDEELVMIFANSLGGSLINMFCYSNVSKELATTLIKDMTDNLADFYAKFVDSQDSKNVVNLFEKDDD